MLLLCLRLCLALGGLSVQAGAWEVAPQPKLEKALTDAPLLEPEQLGVVVKSVQSYKWRAFVPNPDGKTYDVLQWYYREYDGPTWLYAIDLGTGRAKRQRFPDKRSIHMVGQTLGPDGKYYIATPYWYYGAQREAAKLGIPTGMELFVYDPATNELENRGVIVPGLTGERRPLTRGPDGKLYGVGTYLKQGKVGVYSYDTKTGKVREYSAVGPKHRGGAWAGHRLVADETHIYTLSGFTPYYLVAVNIKTGEDKVLLETEPGGEMRMRDGPSVDVKESIGAEVVKKYWLHEGAAIPKTNNARPWTRKKTPYQPPKPDVYGGEVVPDAQGRAKLWYRPPRDASAGARSKQRKWKSVGLKGIESYPLRIKLLAALPDGRIFCKAEGHYGGALFDPKTGEVTASGDCDTEAYSCLVHAGKIYWTGYSSGQTYVYDPNRPWNLLKGVPPGRKAIPRSSAESNPRELALMSKYRVSQMLSSVVGADGKLYLCGWDVRAYKGGAFCWVNLETEEKGGMWRPFIGYRTYWLTTALDRRFVVVSTATTGDTLNDWKKPSQAKLFVWDTQTGKFVREIEPVLRSERTGPVLEVQPGRLIGIADDPDNKGGGILYGVDVRIGEVLFRKKLPFIAPIVTSHTTHQCGYQVGPDGHIWTILGRYDSNPGTLKTLVRIDPKDGRVEPVGRVRDMGNFIFVGKYIYLTGTDQLRRIHLQRSRR